MALYQKWDVKIDFAYVLQFFSLISDSLGSVREVPPSSETLKEWGKKLRGLTGNKA